MTDATATAADAGWRASVQQSYRNTEVREISKVLAALEPGATPASKLRLASQFEATVFNTATSLENYRKTLAKRLKKLQKNYVPPVAAAAPTTDIQSTIKELRNHYGEDLLYILKHADTAVAEMKAKYGEEKAIQLRQHTDGVRIWATDLGVLPGTEENAKGITAEQLEKLKTYLERKTENIRAHIVKLADAERFLAETLAKKETDFAELANPQPSKILAQCAQRRHEHLYEKLHKTKPLQKPNELLAEAMEKAQAAVPLPTRSVSQQQLREGLSEADITRALKHLDKMRAAGTVCLAYMSIADKKTVPPKTLVKANQIVNDGIQVCQEILKTQRENAPPVKLTLEDAWMKPLVFTTDEVPEDTGDAPPFKRRRLMSKRQVIKSRVLLIPNRKAPSNLLSALKRKGAKLIRPEPFGIGSHLLLDFGCFEMVIYLVPLVVLIRAKESSTELTTTEDQTQADLNHRDQIYDENRHRWKPLHQGLCDNSKLDVWGATADGRTLGYIVQERLRDASAHATHALRQCFSSTAKATGDFETEILEATALLEFIKIARTTYIPDWVDLD
jgi:hypothetical protein